ncbi:MAG: TetR/AcrR family transcriptional regulator [Acidobacteriota bacterium]|nr:TetR/AcrR family transcriptional regulator [Acidobacteriota bacterium]
MGKRRATTSGERAARRRHILSAAAALLEAWSVDDVNIDRIAERAGIAKGTVYLYFRTREELFLEVFDRHHALWLEAVETALGSAADELSPGDAGRIFVASLTERPLLLRLYGRLGALLGGSVSPQAMQDFRLRQTTRLTSVAQVLHRRFPRLTIVQAQRWMFRMEVFVAGIAPLGLPTQATAGWLTGPEQGGFVVDLESELQYIAVTMLLTP